MGMKLCAALLFAILLDAGPPGCSSGEDTYDPYDASYRADASSSSDVSKSQDSCINDTTVPCEMKAVPYIESKTRSIEKNSLSERPGRGAQIPVIVAETIEKR